MLEDQVYLEQLKRDYIKSLQLGKILIERSDAGVKTFQLVGLTYKAIADYKEARKLYDRALLKFPNSGVLYNEYGDLYSQMGKSSDAIKQWEKGIELDPAYGNNYYYAAKHYAGHKNPLWAMLYGEIFVNIESYSERTNEMKVILTELFKRISAPGFIKVSKDNVFAVAVAANWAKQSPIALNSVTVESLTSLRTSFIKDWYIINSSKFPYKLFEYQDQLAKEGLFDAYNQWLFGAAINEPAYNSWSSVNKSKMEAFKKFQAGRVFKVPVAQYYQTK
jgi:tetratricopeptide (TPR) repeat protein